MGNILNFQKLMSEIEIEILVNFLYFFKKTMANEIASRNGLTPPLEFSVEILTE